MAEGDQGGSKGGTGDQVIKVGEKEYSVADVENLIANTATLTQKGESVQGILDMCTRYDMEPSEFLDQASGGLTVISNLIKEGVIDEQGRAVKPEGKELEDKRDLSKIKDQEKDTKDLKGGTKTEEIVAKALEGIAPTLKDLGDQVTKMQNIQTSMIHDDYRTRIIKKHPNLDDKDADQVLALAMNDSKKDLWQHAEDASTAKVASSEKIERAYAEKRGLDYDVLKKADENKLNEQEPEGGAAPVLKGKKIKLFGATGDDEVSAGDAAAEFLEKQLGGD